MKIKILFLIIIFTITSTCKSRIKKTGDIFFKEYYQSSTKSGCLNVYISNDTIFKNRNTYFSDDNYLEYSIKTNEDRTHLNNILSILSNQKVDLNYGGGNFDYSLYWNLIINDIKAEVMDSINPIILNPIYNFINSRVDDSNNNFKKILNPEFSCIVINTIEKIGQSEFIQKKDIMKEKESYLLWQKLMKAKKRDFFKIDKINDFNYEVNFSYLLDCNQNKKIDKIYLKDLDILAIKYEDYDYFKAIKLGLISN